MSSGPRRACSIVALLGWLFATSSAHAQSGSTCDGQLREAQELQYAGKLLLARPLAVACAEATTCDDQSRQTCRQLLAALRRQIPSLVFSIRDEAGYETDQVSLYVDGELRTQALPPTPFELDAGAHTLRAELRSGRSQTLRVVLVAGEQLRRIDLSFERKAARKPAMAATGTPRWLTVSLGSLALVSAGSFAYFAVDGHSRANDLQKQCAPACTEGPVRDMRRAFLVADISWIVGALAAGGATWSFMSEAHDQ
jgi:hypothetical protein